MTDAFLSAVVQTVLGTLNSVTLQEIGLFWGFKDELNKLETTFTTIQLVLHDAELKQRKNIVIQNWLRKLKIVACDVENILDRIATEGLRRNVDSATGSFRKNPFLFRLKMAHKVRNVRERLDAIAEERVKFHLGEGNINMGNRYGDVLESRQTSSLVNEVEIYGRQEEKDMIIEKLFDDKTDDLSVYAIWGMGGLGKTTLAQMVYNDERVDTFFELRIWVCVSDDFSVQRLVRAIIESIQGGGCNISELDPLQRLVQELLRGKRFLLILDDVWSENHWLWDELKQVLKCGSKGSMLMVTTRIEKVALIMATIGTHHIGCLSKDDSWSLFKKRAFASRDVEDKILVAIGKEIVKKCGGVPFAIKALGSLLQLKSHESEWLAIKESEIWHMRDDDNGILPVLRLSYDNLPPTTRQCFAYCCIFPKDYVMEENKLIQLWMANGFILSSPGQTDLLLIGHLIFKELVWRSFFQDVEINSRGKMMCKMHDLMHDLALSVMGHETYNLEHGKAMKIPKTLLHLSIDSNLSSRPILDNKSKFKLSIDDSLRSLIVRGREVTSEGFFSFILKQKYLRALDVNYCIIVKSPNTVCKMKHLRYLTMSCNNLKKLPESLTCLLNLQTLKLTDSKQLVELPRSLKAMKNLRFLEIETFDSLRYTPPGLGDLTCLRELSIYIVGQDVSHQIDQLKELNLGGKLSILGLDNITNLEDAKSANMMTKSNLTSLRLCWNSDIEKNSAEEHFEEVLEGLQPHHNIETIYIKSYQGSRFPNWISTSACKNLRKISLEHCGRCERLPPFGKLPSLTCLKLLAMDSVKSLDAEWHGDDGESSFSALTTLSIRTMPNLEKWTLADSIESFPSLKHLDIHGCPKLIGLPFLPSLTSLFIFDSSVTLVRSITYLTSLTSLIIHGFSELNVIPEGLLQNHKALEKLKIRALPVKTLSNVLDNLSALKTLCLGSFPNLESLPEGLKYLDSLESLEIMNCHNLESFPAAILEGLPSLRSLFFLNCMKLKPLSGPLKSATTLEDLVIDKCPEMDRFPDSLQRLSNLSELTICECDGLRSLPNWLGSIDSLLEINIENCENLEYLPDGFKNFKSLRKLGIRGCPYLEKRCKKPEGEDWPKVSHIPVIYIDDNSIQCLDDQ